MKKLSTQKELELFCKITHVISNATDLTALLQHITKLISDAFGTDSCMIYLYDEDKEFLVLSGAYTPHMGLLGKVKMKLDEGITGWVASNKETVNVPKGAYNDSRFKPFSSLREDKYESFLSAPILLREQLVGVMNLQTKKSREYNPSEITLLSTLSKMIASAIEIARLHLVANRRAKQIETLAQVSRLVAGKSYLEEILRLIVSITADSLGFKICSLMLLDENKNELAIVATQSLSEDYRKKPPLKVAQSLSGRAVLEKKPIAIFDVRKDPAYHYPGIAKKEGLASLLSVPMMFKDRCIGVLNSYTPELHHFTETETKMMASIAQQAAIAIENTRLMEESLASHEELAARKLIEKAKGILMKEKNLAEDKAFKEMQRTAMDKRKTMKEIAEAIILSREMSHS